MTVETHAALVFLQNLNIETEHDRISPSLAHVLCSSLVWVRQVCFAAVSLSFGRTVCCLVAWPRLGEAVGRKSLCQNLNELECFNCLPHHIDGSTDLTLAK